MKLVSIITVNYGHSYLTEELLNSIYQTNNYSEIEIIVVDNGTIPNPVPDWENRYPKVQFIRSAENLGFAGGNNLGMKAAKGEYLFLVNNDTVFTKSLINILVDRMEANSQIGIISPRILYFDQPDTLQYAGYTPMNYYTARNECIGERQIDLGQFHLAAPTGYIHGAAMMLRRSVWEATGGMAAHFFLYYEELDWCDRIKKAGYEVWIDPAASIYHKESITVGKNSPLKTYFMNRNRILYIRRNASWYQVAVFYIYFITVVVPRNILSYIQQGNPAYIRQLFRAIRWNFSHSKNSPVLGYRN